MSAKTEIGNVRLYLFWSLLKIPRFFSITENCKQKIWLKQPKAASALDFSYFQHASKLVTHHMLSDQNRYTHLETPEKSGVSTVSTAIFNVRFIDIQDCLKIFRQDMN